MNIYYILFYFDYITCFRIETDTPTTTNYMQPTNYIAKLICFFIPFTRKTENLL